MSVLFWIAIPICIVLLIFCIAIGTAYAEDWRSWNREKKEYQTRIARLEETCRCAESTRRQLQQVIGELQKKEKQFLKIQNGNETQIQDLTIKCLNAAGQISDQKTAMLEAIKVLQRHIDTDVVEGEQTESKTDPDVYGEAA